MNPYNIPAYLRRTPRRRGPSPELLLLILFLVVSIAVLIVSVLMSVDAMPHAHAAERTYTGIIKDGVVITPQTFCNTL
jgi:hypothetical protein